MSTDAQGRRLLAQIRAAADTHRADCQRTNFRGDRSSCAGVADEAMEFVTGPGARLLARSEAGEVRAHENLMLSGQRILATVGGAFEAIADGAQLSDLAKAIRDDVAKVATFGGIGLAGIGAIALVAYLVVGRR